MSNLGCTVCSSTYSSSNFPYLIGESLCVFKSGLAPFLKYLGSSLFSSLTATGYYPGLAAATGGLAPAGAFALAAAGFG
jgi:hypothetical protein